MDHLQSCTQQRGIIHRHSLKYCVWWQESEGKATASRAAKKIYQLGLRRQSMDKDALKGSTISPISCFLLLFLKCARAFDWPAAAAM
jgi:hypothetical protein